MSGLRDDNPGPGWEAFAAHAQSPAVGPVTALVAALAAGIVANVARASAAWADAAGVAAQAEALRSRLAPLVEADADALARARELLAGGGEGTPEARDFQLGLALARAAEIPLQIAELAADVAMLGALVAEHGVAEARADAVGATALAETCTRAAAHLVEVNLGVSGADDRVRRCREARDAAAEALERTVAS